MCASYDGHSAIVRFVSGSDDDAPKAFELLAQCDPELARKMAEVLLPLQLDLSGYEDRTMQIHKTLVEFADYTLPHSGPPPAGMLAEARKLVGLPPRTESQSQQPAGAGPLGGRFSGSIGGHGHG
jgi:hypothetical protein